MSDTSSKSKSEQVKISELLLSAKNLSRQIEKMRKMRMVGEKVVDLKEFRTLKMDHPEKLVLFIDEDEDMLDEFRPILKRYGYEILSARDPAELTNTIENQSFDMIVLDVNLAWLDGYEFCSLLKSHRLLRDIPIILLNHDVPKQEIRRGFEAGCDEYLSKPIEPDKLARTIRFFLSP
jgi:CheY-like chemotaxis protein